MTVKQHLLACTTLTFLTLNLSFWCLLLLVLLPFDKLLVPYHRTFRHMRNGIYRRAVRLDDWWLLNVCGNSWDLPELNYPRDKVLIVVANHYSWTDIFLLQNLITRRGPVIKFLCKFQLLFVPIFGLIILAFGFPIVRRSSMTKDSVRSRTSDIQNIKTACQNLPQDQAAILIFLEGTRFKEQKRVHSNSPFHHLLAPKYKGFETLFNSLHELQPDVLDVTLFYPPSVNFWRFLGGGITDIKLNWELHSYTAIQASRMDQWLANRWQEKDAQIAGYLQTLKRPGS